jgi:hypothetical protein
MKPPPRQDTAYPEIPSSSVSSQLYWLCRHLATGLWRWLKRHRVLGLILLVVGALGLLVFRGWVHPLVLGLRLHLAPVLLALLLLGGTGWCWRKGRRTLSAVGSLVILGGLFLFLIPRHGPREYLTLWWHYQGTPKETLATLPVTAHERVHPRNAVQTLAREGISEVHEVSSANFVRDGEDYVWTMAIEPAFLARRLVGTTQAVLRVRADQAALNFSRENRSDVRFITGESMLWGRNARLAALKRLDPWRYFNLEPTNVRYLRNDAGEWVQVVSFIRWKGWFLPRPVFGGVMVIPQVEGATGSLVNVFGGLGTYHAPGEVSRHRYLTGQNLLPEEVSRFTAESFRFSRGFLAPFPGYRLGDIRIPDVAGDHNDQPFTSYFAFPDGGKLYHYFALEPFLPDKQGLNASVFVPADGIGEVRVYRHYDRGEALTGVSAIVAKVMESRKNYDWSRNSAAEQRPYIRDWDGQRRFFWLTTVVTHKEDAEGGAPQFIAGAAPDVTLTDALWKTVIWVNPLSPSAWPDEVEQQMREIWSTGIPAPEGD